MSREPLRVCHDCGMPAYKRDRCHYCDLFDGIALDLQETA